MNSFYSLKEMEHLGLKKYGEDVRISKLAVITHPELLSIGSHVAIDPFVYISPKMEMGNYIHIAPFVGIGGTRESSCVLRDFTSVSQGCKLICGTDRFLGEGLLGPVIPEKFRSVIHGKIIMERFSALAANVTVMPNILVGEGSVVGACSLVTENVKSWSVYHGVPAKFVKKREKDKMIRFAEELEKWRNQS